MKAARPGGGSRRARLPSKRVARLYDEFSGNLSNLRYLNKVLPRSVKAHEEGVLAKWESKLRELSPKGQRELTQFIEFVKRKKGQRTMRITDRTLGEALMEAGRAVVFASRTNSFIREMSLVYLVARFEEFVTEVLTTGFRARPEILKSSKKQVTYEEIFDAAQLPDIQDRIIGKEVSAIVEDGIDSVGGYLDTRFGFKWTSDPEWKQLRERFYRRNLVIHNNGRPNEIYRRKTGYRGKQEKLEVSQKYLTDSISLFGEFAKSLADHFASKVLPPTEETVILNQGGAGSRTVQS